MMSVTGTLVCMMSAVFATGLLMLCDSAVVKTRSPLYHMNYVTYPPSTTLLTGTLYYFGTYPTMPTLQNYCIRDGKRYSVGESIHTNPCAYCFCTVGGYISCRNYDCNMQYPWCDDFYFENPDDCCVRCPIGYNCTAPDGEFVQYKELYYLNNEEVCHCLGRKPNETAVCKPVNPSTKHAPIIG